MSLSHLRPQEFTIANLKETVADTIDQLRSLEHMMVDLNESERRDKLQRPVYYVLSLIPFPSPYSQRTRAHLFRSRPDVQCEQEGRNLEQRS